MKIINKGILTLLLTLCLTLFLTQSVELKVEANASNALKTRYTTQTVALRAKASGKAKTIYKVKANTRLAVTKIGKSWSTVKYKGRTLYTPTKTLHKDKPINVYPGKKFKRRGRAKWNRASWTWYSQRVLPGRGLKIPGRHVDRRGFVCDKDGYICLASGRTNKKKKAVVATPFGKFGKVYDTNGRNNNKWFDVYVNW